MNILSLFDSFLNHFNNILHENIYFHELETKIYESTHDLNLDILREILEFIDLDFKNSKERKNEFHVQCTRQRTLITSLGIITFNKTYYRSKEKTNDKYQFFSYLEDYLGLDKWAKMTLKAEVNLINNALDNGMSWSVKNTIPNTEVSRQTISKKIKNINYNFKEEIKTQDTPKTIYIEADEVHSNLQNKGGPKKNKIVPVILTHEGHKEDFVKKKQLKNKHYIASSILKTHLLWNETYKYLDTKYDLDKVEYIFISGDGASWIKGFDEAFPNAIYVFDKFHYQKALNALFKKEEVITSLADEYLRARMIDEFILLVNVQLKKYPEQYKRITKYRNLLLNNVDGIINQRHLEYKCPCSMEGHISNVYARHLTSRPHSYSKDGLENTVQLITMKANGIILTEDIYHQFKHGISNYKQLNLEKFITKFRLQSNKVYTDLPQTYSLNYSNFNLKDQDKLNYYFNKRS